MNRNTWSALDSLYPWASSLRLAKSWSARRISTRVEPCLHLRILRSRTQWAEALIIGSFIPSPCALKATTCERTFSVQLRTICVCRRASYFDSWIKRCRREETQAQRFNRRLHNVCICRVGSGSSAYIGQRLFRILLLQHRSVFDRPRQY